MFSAIKTVNGYGTPLGRLFRTASRPAAACAALFFCVTGAIADEVIVELKDSVSLLPGNVVTIGDIADVRTASARLKQRIESLDVADALTESSVQRVNRRELEMRMLIAGISSAELAVIGADQAVVSATTRGSFVAGLEKQVAADLAKQFGLESNSVSVQIGNKASLKVLEGQLAGEPYLVRLVFGDRLPVGRSQIECRFETSRGSVTQRLDAYVTVTREVAITTMPILSGTRVEPSMIQVVKRPLVSTASYVDPESIVGKTASRNIESNQLLQPNFFRTRRTNETLVKRYDLIDVYIQFGGGQVRLKDAKVMSQGGNAGDTIEVLNTRTNKRLSAIVVDRNTAKRTPLTGSGS
ncbi:MAG: flagellar basal body P-ring formation chaperone FlgA [Aureliella sp.]